MIERFPSIHSERPRAARGTVSRRAVTIAGGSVAVAGMLAACAGDAPAGDGGADAGTGAPGGDAAGGDTGAGPLATVPLAEVPVGSGLIVSEVPLVVTQPTEGDVRAFSGICTHQGCAVATISTRGIMCPCHSSLFDLSDGSPIGGPATEPLPALAADIDGENVTVTSAG